MKFTIAKELIEIIKMEYYLSNLERIWSWYEKLSCSIETGPVHRYFKKPTGPTGFYLSDCIRDENGRERVRKPFNASISILYYEKREPKRNNRECERNRMYGQRKWAWTKKFIGRHYCPFTMYEYNTTHS